MNKEQYKALISGRRKMKEKVWLLLIKEPEWVMENNAIKKILTFSSRENVERYLKESGKNVENYTIKEVSIDESIN
jgi:hypothetical protein